MLKTKWSFSNASNCSRPTTGLRTHPCILSTWFTDRAIVCFSTPSRLPVSPYHNSQMGGASAAHVPPRPLSVPRYHHVPRRAAHPNTRTPAVAGHARKQSEESGKKRNIYLMCHDPYERRARACEMCNAERRVWPTRVGKMSRPDTKRKGQRENWGKGGEEK